MADIHDQKEIIFLWSVKNFSFCPQEKCQYLLSPVLYTKDFFDITWRLFLYPKGSANSKPDDIACDLSLSWPDSTSDCLPVRVEIGIVDNSGLHKKSFATETNRFWRETLLRNSLLISRHELYHDREEYLPNDILTIYCHAWRYSNSVALARRYFARTTIETDGCVFRFEIHNFTQWKTDQPVRIPVPLSSKFEIVVYLVKATDKDENIAVDICRTEPEDVARLLQCTLSIWSNKGIPERIHGEEHLFKSEIADKTWTISTLLSKASLIGNKQFFLKDDTLTLECKFAISCGKPANPAIYVCEPTRKISVSPSLIDTLKDDLQRMFLEKKFSDVQLKAGGKLFSAHKAILSVRSPVFQAMFEQDMMENQSGTVDIADLDAETLRSMLLYIYTGALENCDWDSVYKLLVAADKYQIIGLRENCVTTLKSTLSVQTVCKVLVLADLQEDRDLEGAALDFIFTNRCEVLKSNEWIEFIESNRKLSSEILRGLSNHLA